MSAAWDRDERYAVGVTAQVWFELIGESPRKVSHLIVRHESAALKRLPHLINSKLNEGAGLLTDATHEADSRLRVRAEDEAGGRRQPFKRRRRNGA